MLLYVIDFGTLINPFPKSPSAVSETAPFVSRLIGTLTIFGGIAMMVYLTFGAVQWSTSAGDKGQVDAAKKTITNAVIGIVIITAAYILVGIIGKILGFEPLKPVIFVP